MNILREAIKALFDDYPVSDLLNLIKGKSKGRNQRYLKDVAKIISARNPKWNTSGIELITEILDEDWMRNEPNLNRFGALERCFLLPLSFGNLVLTDNSGEPKVKLEELLRWRDVTSQIGEDLTTICFLARHDLEERSNFCWKGVLETDQNWIIESMQNGVCDLHCHLNATHDIFLFNWIALMNHIERREGDFMSWNHTMSQHTVLRDYLFSDFYQHCILAAHIRYYLYRTFVLGDMTEEVMVNDLLLQDEQGRYSFHNENIETLQADIENLISEAKSRYEQDSILDYAITMSLDDNEHDSPYVIHSGERQIMYRFMRRYLRGQIRNQESVQLFYLYERIKTEFRKELIATNMRTGLRNFKLYNGRRDTFPRQDERLKRAKLAYGIQTSMENPFMYLEGRVCPGEDVTLKDSKYNCGLLTEEKLFEKVDEDTDEEIDRLSFVFHLTKQGDFQPGNRCQIEFRKGIMKDMDAAIKLILNPRSPFVGIDCAGSELYSRPETFGHIFRYAMRMRVWNVTYHVGEDFYDLVDGLRAIDEAIRFLELGSGCRLGHALALGLDCKLFYENNNYELIVPAQYHLDNLVWLIKRAESLGVFVSPSLDMEYVAKCEELFKEIGYKGVFDINNYYASMLLRSDDECENLDDEIEDYIPWKATIRCQDAECMKYRDNKHAIELFHDYLGNENIYKNGNKPVVVRIEDRYVRLVMKIQSALLIDVENRGICIEGKLTSNVMISSLDRYDRHPILRFKSPADFWGNHIPVALGTDDKGVFATSLQNEYAILAVSMRKQRCKMGRKYSDRKIKQYLKDIAETSITYKFNKDGNKLFVE